jgi:hypothetical protein
VSIKNLGKSNDKNSKNTNAIKIKKIKLKNKFFSFFSVIFILSFIGLSKVNIFSLKKKFFKYKNTNSGNKM